ncbi:septin-2-like isoform X1 [Hydractinia symbiolongicarpus]|uniref:septin-2-like isoform X1 n=1 Tax=Hydractinia symbiolongicarpus TaxID=13093 RepID=UPI00254DE75E|nr:septin-2-like isoform X1 [Hydractinia symbiolongicarpus]
MAKVPPPTAEKKVRYAAVRSRSTESKAPVPPLQLKKESSPQTNRLSGASFSFTPSPKIVETKPASKEDAGIYVGFANLPNQVHRKSVKRGFEFTLMVVGESGLGKSTLVDSLFLTSLYAEREIPYAIDRIKKSVSVTTSTVEIEEKGVKLKLTVVDTPGYGDSVNNAASWTPIVNYINEQYEAYLRDESGLNRRNIIDNRVHCCLYFVNPVGHGLKPLDVMVMQALHDKVNIVPVIAKADTLTKKEVSQLKQRILREIQENNIQIYQFPEADEEEDDEEFIAVNKELKTSVPFAVVGSNTVYEVNGRKVRGRIYPWGVVDIENPAHCDFTMLRNMLIRTHMQDLKDVTQDIHYENFRAMKLASGEPPLIREEESSRSNKNSTVDNRDALLLEKEAELKRMQEQIAKLQADMMVKQSNHVDTPSSEVK